MRVRRRGSRRAGSWQRGLLLAAEPVRAASELATTALAAPALALQHRGDGHSVLVIPGWLADDRSTLLLRRYVSALGYDVHGWGQGINRGATVGTVAALRDRLVALACSSGAAVSVIGWSLGGYYAHQLARRNPANVRQLITLGAPGGAGRIRARTGSRLADQVTNDRWGARAIPRPWDERGSLRVPITAVHSRTDPMLAWQRSLLAPARNRQNVAVRGSHVGLGHNPAVLHVIADRLGQRPQEWRPFRPAPVFKPLFPSC
jgi:pimeloyl-ACP methyl ester carboxylesterase